MRPVRDDTGIKMPSTSRSQQRLMGMVHAYQAGKLKGAPAKVREVAQRIDPQDAQDFAATAHKGLPEKSAGLSPGTIAGLAAATTAALPLAGELIGFAHAPRGYRAEGTGRGFLQGAGAGVGAATGGLLGLAAGPALTAALGDHISPETAWLLTVNSPLVGAVGGGALGANLVQQQLGRPRWEEALNRLAVYRADRQLHPHEKNSAVAGNPLILAGRPSMPKLTPSGPNAATQINTTAASGPGVGGAATATAAAAQLPQAQAAAGMVQTVPSARLQAAPPAAPPTGFQPNAQGQVVYPKGQGPVTGQVAPAQKFSFMQDKANQPLRQSSTGAGDLRILQIKPTRVDGPAVFDQFQRKQAWDYSQLYAAVGADAYLRAFLTKCAAAGYSGQQACQAAQDCSRVSDLAARAFAPLCKLAAPWGMFGKLLPKVKGLAPKLFRGGEEAALGAEQAAPRFFWNAPAGAGAGVEAAAGREALGAGAGLLSSMRGPVGAATAAPHSYWQAAKAIGGQPAWQAVWRLGMGGAGYAAGGTADLAAYGFTGQDPGLRNIGGAAGLVGRRGVAGYGAGYVADTAAQGLGLGDPGLRNVGAVAGGLSNFAGPLAQIPGRVGAVAGATDRFMGGMTGQGLGALEHGGRVLGQVPYAADRATRLGQLTGTYAERAGLGAMGYEALQHADARGYRRGTGDSAAIQTNPQRAAELDVATEKNHPGYLAQKQQQIQVLAQDHPQVVEAVRTGNPAAIIPTIPAQLQDPRTSQRATQQVLGTWEPQLEARAQLANKPNATLEEKMEAYKSQKALEGLKSMRANGIDEILAKGQPGYQPGNPTAAAAPQADPAAHAQAQAHTGALDALWNWFQGLDGQTQLLLGAGLLAAVGGLFTERPGMALGGLALAGLAPALDSSDPYGVRGYFQGQPPAPPTQDPTVPPPAAQPTLAAPPTVPGGVSTFHPHQALPSVG